MTPNEQRAYVRGQQRVYRDLLGVALRGLGVDDAPDDLAAAQRRIGILEADLARVRARLAGLCAEFGDNDWSEDDDLGDVIDKHLGRHLRSPGRKR